MEEDEEPEVKYIDSEDFQQFQNHEKPHRRLEIRWISSFSENEKKWHKLLTEFLAPLPDYDKYGSRIVEQYAKALNSQGIETIITGNRADERYATFLRRMAPRRPEKGGNLALVLRNVSEVTGMVNAANYVNTVLMRLGLDKRKEPLYTRQICPSRVQLLHLHHENYRQLLEVRLSHHSLLRAFRYHRRRNNLNKIGYRFLTTDIFALAPHTSLMALQTVLADWNCRIRDEKIIQIAHANSIQMRPITVRGDGFGVLCEALCATVALKFHGAQQEIEQFDELLHSRSTYPPAKRQFQIWKLISNFERSWQSANAQGFLISAQRLEEEAESMGAECCVLIETACRIRHLCGDQEEEIVKNLTNTVTRHPSLGPKMIKLAEKFGVSYETEALLQIMCDPADNSAETLHPSEPMWLEYVENQVNAIGRFGSIRESLQKMLKAIFEFLDYDSNRFNEKAWKLMKKVLELSDPSFVVIEFESRKSWWVEYQKTPSRNGRTMSRKAEKRKRQVLEALEAY